MSAAAVSGVLAGVGVLLVAAAAVYAPATVVGTFLRADALLAGVSLLLSPVALLMPPTYPGEPRIFGVRAWLVRRAFGVTREVIQTVAADHGVAVAAQASTPSTTF